MKSPSVSTPDSREIFSAIRANRADLLRASRTRLADTLHIVDAAIHLIESGEAERDDRALLRAIRANEPIAPGSAGNGGAA